MAINITLKKRDEISTLYNTTKNGT